MKLTSTILLLWTICLQNIFGQNSYTLELIDESTGQILMGAHLIQTNHKGIKKYYLSDEDGKVNLQGTDSDHISISYTGFKTVNQKLGINLSQKIVLSVDLFNLDEVVMTAQLGSVKVDKSIYDIGVLSREVLESRNIQNVQEALQFEPTIQLSQDPVLGTQIVMQGLEGQHVKILIDGVPIIGRQNGNIDLSQIDASSIDHIEIIEGPMSVVYGSNALAGTINIISKTDSPYNFESQLGTYYETVGLFTVNGLISMQGKKNQFATDFSGRFFDGFDLDKSSRQLDWAPKNLYNANLSYTYRENKWIVNSRIRFNLEDLTYKGNYTSANRAFDTNFKTQRMTYVLNIDKEFSNSDYLKSQLSFNTFDRESQRYYVKEDEGTSNRSGEPTEDYYDQINYRLSYKHDFSDSVLLNAGYELDSENGKGEKVANNKGILSNALWADLQWRLAESLTFQPGLRYMIHNTYDAPLIYAGHFKFNQNNWTARMSYAKGFRAPSIKELYMDFVDSNHQIYGNPELNPETSHSLSLGLSKYLNLNNSRGIKIDFNTFYNHLSDVIELVQDQNSQGFIYNNISQKKTQGLNTSFSYQSGKRVRFSMGLNLTGIAYDLEVSQDFNFDYSLDYTSSLSYTFPSQNLDVRLDFKHNGKRQQTRINSEDQIYLVETDPYDNLDLNINKTFSNGRWILGAGIKNILDVSAVNSNANTGAHNSGSGTLIDWGRSYFISLKFNLKTNKHQ